MRPQWSDVDVDCELVFDRYLGETDDLDVLQEVLLAQAPTWTSKLRVWRSRQDQRFVDPSRPGALKAAVLAAAGERGPTYRALVALAGAGDERLTGSAELRGAGPELVAVVSVDERVASRLGDMTNLGNSIALQVRRATVDKRDAAGWLAETFETLCARLSPAWGSAYHSDEYWTKVMSDEPRIEAVGRDFGRHLPGVFWLNFFGPRYCALVGDERLKSTPAHQVTFVDSGLLVATGKSPLDWATPQYARTEQEIRQHLGDELFFTKSDPSRPTTAPKWET
jgi:hypothetical protein